MKRQLKASVWQEGDVFVAQCLDVDIASQGATREEALDNLRQAIELHFTPPVATFDPDTALIEVDVPADKRIGRMPKWLSTLLVIALVSLPTIYFVWAVSKGFSALSTRHTRRIVTTRGDRFFLETEKDERDFLDTFVITRLYEGKDDSGEPILVDSDGNFQLPDFDRTPIYDSPEIRCYRMGAPTPYLIFTTSKSGNFSVIHGSAIREASPGQYPFMVDMAKNLCVSAKEWVWFSVFAEFLLKAHDPEMEQTMRRYAAGTFTPDERKRDAESEKIFLTDSTGYAVTTSHITDLAKKYCKRYSLK